MCFKDILHFAVEQFQGTTKSEPSLCSPSRLGFGSTFLKGCLKVACAIRQGQDFLFTFFYQVRIFGTALFLT